MREVYNAYAIYHCYGGAHSSVTAAIHARLIPENTIPTSEELLSFLL